MVNFKFSHDGRQTISLLYRISRNDLFNLASLQKQHDFYFRQMKFSI